MTERPGGAPFMNNLPEETLAKAGLTATASRHEIHEGTESGPFDGEWTTLSIHHPKAIANEHDLEDGIASQVGYKDKGDHLQVGYRATHQDFQRQGLGSVLQDELERRAEGRPIRSNLAEMSQDAVDFRDAYRARNPRSTWRDDTP